MRTITLSSNTSWYLLNFRASTITRFLADGYRVVCLSPPDSYSEGLQKLGCVWLPLHMDNSGNNPVRDLLVVARFWRYYRILRPVAAFHFTVKNNIYGTWAARLLRIPAVNNVSGLGTAFIRNGVVPAVVRLLYRLSQPLAYRVFCQNAEDYQVLISRKLVPRDRLKLLPGSGVDLNRFHPRLKKRRSGSEPFRFLYAGRMLADKGLHELIQAFGEVREDFPLASLALCGFAGSDNISAIQESTLREWGTRPGVQWLGPSDAMETVYAETDCVVLPSYREGMPRSLLEAGAMALPVIATNVPGCRNIVEHGVNGLLCESQSISSLRAALEQMLTLDQDQRERMGLAGRRRVEAEFSEELVVDAAVEVVQSLGSQG